MHVLRQIHKALRAGGVLLDVHPQPEDPRVEILRGDRSKPVGVIDWTADSRDIRDARTRLASMQRAGLFHLERRRIFEIRIYHESVEAWLEYRRERGSSSVIHPDVLRAARRGMRGPGSRLVIRERIRASVFRRSDPP